MLDAREPKNGDFASYVENLAPLPGQNDKPATAPSAAAPAPTRARRARGEPAAPAQAPGAGAAWGHQAKDGPHGAAGRVEEIFQKLQSAANKAEPPSPEVIASARRMLSTLLGRIATGAGIVGVVLIGASLLEEPLPFADPSVGVFLLILAAVAGRIARKVA